MQISKRDYFAAAALTGLLARAGGPGKLSIHENVSIEAFIYADAMMRHSKTLLDPVEIDPDELAKAEEERKKGEASAPV